MDQVDPRRLIPRTNDLLALPAVREARTRLNGRIIRELVRDVQEQARSGGLPAGQVEPVLLAAVAARTATTLRPVLNATGVIVHTNLGRAPLSEGAVAALVAASGYVDVELDLSDGSRSRRGAGARAALLAACPAAEDALVVNNGAAALVLATTALAAGREVVLSRGELVEIGAGFRLTDLMESTGARLREVGTTNRTHLHDYAGALGPDTGCILKVHPSNFRVDGFTSAVPMAELSRLAAGNGVPLVADLGSGLLAPDPFLPDEPDAATALASGADVVIASGDKLLGGPQAGLLLGRREVIARLARHPLARAVRADKLALAALEATVAGGPPPVVQALHADAGQLRRRTDRLARELGAAVVPHDGRVGGGGAPGVPLAGWALRLPEGVARLLRTGDPAVLPRVHDGFCLVDLRCVPERDDARIAAAVREALASLEAADAGRAG
ncbi:MULTISPECIES: L-seryl-tRNA(Sec) selenium transferase [Pseudarthrobacter]|uniref:L-seryl-tRNA(Sec) selenium transferase n=1 Tax=Pseudarthrobacter niigatensis TaxID=369935 RepID=A0AAJ1SPP5_9MICC|nr:MULTISPECIES: L-seryl-tRNA(Sec) selenium transferase [Pseudarthrobacter]MDQ0144564.1 L-seryl-tRNA(Ser) seleniumtransferase [Pseudarthrobacter niigatensis]MDQ0265210.1 L-seryl-tRNA(Ser) seleniumtransferase [Pseudarthrobacter niigatensis]NUT70887.1 L-seryl-tRNA(Sec) selenium transferase [Pseudarthrobacter sp. C4D7]QDG63630.1 L-seryl-tRNA(Sec) selenium transferase [Pseudarthrobacter sp. NIBRBAC000502771]